MDKTSYYSSHAKLPFIGNAGQKLLEEQKALVIGAGGLGCPCLQSLAGAGIGTIGVADFDRVAVSNLPRQTLYQYADVSKSKVAVAAERLSKFNPFIRVLSHDVAADENNIVSLIGDYTVIIDATDNFASRYLINDACVFLNKPLIYGAIHQSEGHVTVFNYNGSATLRCLFPDDQNETAVSCAEIGAYNITTGIIGLMMANEVIKITLQHADVLAGKLLQIDTLTGKTLTVQYPLLVESIQKSLHRFTASAGSKVISPATLKEKIKNRENFYLIDVREAAEHLQNNIGGVNIPLQQLMQADLDFSSMKEIIVYCQKGNRSRRAAEWITAKGFSNAVSLLGGIELFRQNPA